MDCDQVISQLFAYLDGELTVWRRTAITRHLSDCGHCSEGFDYEQRIQASIQRMMVLKCAETAPDRLRFRIADALGVNVDPNSP